MAQFHLYHLEAVNHTEGQGAALFLGAFSTPLKAQERALAYHAEARQDWAAVGPDADDWALWDEEHPVPSITEQWKDLSFGEAGQLMVLSVELDAPSTAVDLLL